MVRSVIGVALLAVAGSALAGAPPQWQAISRMGGDGIRLQAPAPLNAPEIDPAGAISALTLVLGGLAIVRGRRKS